jgi:predicted PurR-regulated permease PerM
MMKRAMLPVTNMAGNEKTLGYWALLGLFVLVLYFCYRIMEPFLMPVFLALILSTLLSPAYEKLAGRLNNRPSLAALLICIGLTLAFLLPVLLLSMSLAREANQVYDQLRNPETSAKLQFWFDLNANPIIERLRSWIPASVSFENFDIGARIGAQIQAIGAAVLAYAGTFAAGVFGFLVDYFIMVVVLFFLLRDSNYFAERMREISPLSDADERMFVDRFRIVTRATVFGNLLTAAVQGFLSGLIYLILGLPNPILWGALTALFSLVPVVGTALIWAPWTIYLLASGSIARGIIFAILQIVLVGGADNVLRPMLIEGRVKMHTLVVFFSILGGISYFGILGMFIGPLVFAIAIAFVEFYGARKADAALTGPT